MEVKTNISDLLYIFEKLYEKQFANMNISSKVYEEFDYEIYKDENTFNVVNDNVYIDIIGKLTDNHEYIYLSRKNISPYDAYQKKIELHDKFKFIIDLLRNIPNEIIILNKGRFEQFWKKLLKDELLKYKQILKVYIFSLQLLKDLWISLKLHETKEEIIKEMDERININSYNICKRNYFEEDFELHKAVYENNLRMIRKICALEM
jgi:hypothetical protein